VQVAGCCKDCGELTGLTEVVLVSQEGLSAMELARQPHGLLTDNSI